MSSGGWGPGSSGRGASRGGRWDDQEEVPARSSSRGSPPGGRDPRAPRDPRDGRLPRDGRPDGRDPGRGQGGTRGGDRPHSRRDVDMDDRRPSSRSGGRSGDRGQVSGGRGRDDWGEPPRGGRSQSARDPDRSRGSTRGAAREDVWAPANTRGPRENDPAGRSRSGTKDASGRSRRPAAQGRGGGLWGDEGDGQGFGSPKGADPRAARRGARGGASRTASPRGRAGRSTGWDAFDDEPSTSTGKTVGIAAGVIFLALVLGAGSAYAYWKVSTPKPTTGTTTGTPAVTSPATTTGTPSTTPSSTPHASVPSGVRVVWLTSDGRAL